MTSAAGQASVEYAGLLALAAALGAALALAAGPPLLDAVRGAIVGTLSNGARRPAPLVATAADIADVQSALLPAGEALTPDAALLALEQRHGEAPALELADSLLLAAARERVPWLGGNHTYRAQVRPTDGPFATESADAQGDRDVEAATGATVVAWVTVEGQRTALAAALAHHTSLVDIGLDLFAAVPIGRLVRTPVKAITRPFLRAAIKDIPEAIDGSQFGTQAVSLVHSDDGGVPAGMRAGDVVISWPAHRTFWRSGHSELDPRGTVGRGPGFVRFLRDYVHIVVLRPGTGGLAVVWEGLAH